MWLSQTYLGQPESNAKLFVYYLWEAYREQSNVPKELIKRLSDAGISFGNAVSFFAPAPGNYHKIRTEIQNKAINELWHSFHDKTPGLFLTNKPISQLNPKNDEFVYFPLPKQGKGNEEAIEKAFDQLHRVCVEKLKEDRNNSSRDLIRTILDAAKLEPSFMGIGMDLKQIVSYIFEKNRKIR